MTNFKDLTGKQFGRLTVLKRVGNDKRGRLQWLCKCNCGSTKIIRGSSLTSGNTLSCGCLAKEKIKKIVTTHNKSKTRLYKIWANIKSRCLNSKSINFYNYGGRGIKICKEWQDNFENFEKWATANGYTDKLTIDRINVNGDYESNNCRWVSPKINSRNKRNNLIFEYQGEEQCLKKWAEDLHINYILLYNRIIRYKWSFKKAITTPIMANRRNRNAKHR